MQGGLDQALDLLRQGAALAPGQFLDLLPRAAGHAERDRGVFHVCESTRSASPVNVLGFEVGVAALAQRIPTTVRLSPPPRGGMRSAGTLFPILVLLSSLWRWKGRNKLAHAGRLTRRGSLEADRHPVVAA